MQSYDEIYERMKSQYTEKSGIVPDENSDIDIRLRVLAGEIYSSLVNVQWLKRQVFADTATGEYLDLHAAERGLKRRKATPSAGKLRFYVVEPATEDLSIPKGTVAACPLTLLRFKTTEDAAIKKGRNSVVVKAESVGEGRQFNVLAGEVTLMVTPPSGVDAVINTEPFYGGCDTESDASLRERVVESIRLPVNSTNCSYYEFLAESIDGVSSAGAVPRGRGAGTVDVYIAADGTQVSDNTLSIVQQKLSKEREVNVDVLVLKAVPSNVDIYIEISVSEGYSFEEVKKACVKAVSDYINNRGVGKDVLLCHVAECIYHTEGVSSFRFLSGLNNDFRGENRLFPVAGKIDVRSIE